MKFQIEENSKTLPREFFNRSRTLRCEKLAADLEHSGRALKLARQITRQPETVCVECYD